MTRTTSEAHAEIAPIDLYNVTVILAEAMRLTRALDKQQPPPGNNPQLAAAKRDMLYLADTLDRAAAETRAQYHAVNGRPDVLDAR